MNVLSIIAASIKANTIGIPTGSGEQVLAIGLDMIYYASGIIAVIVAIIGGLRIMTETDSTKVAQARESVLHAIIGIVIILSAFTITHFILGRL
jgi:hypothetical protein